MDGVEESFAGSNKNLPAMNSRNGGAFVSAVAKTVQSPDSGKSNVQRMNNAPVTSSRKTSFEIDGVRGTKLVCTKEMYQF